MDDKLKTNRQKKAYGPWSIVYCLLCLACSPKPFSQTLAIVNGEKVTLADFQKALELEQWKFNGSSKKLKTGVLDSLLKDRLLLQEAEKRQINVSNTEVEQNLSQFKNIYPKANDFEKMLESRGLTTDDFKKRRVQEIKIRKLMEQITAKQVRLTDEDLRQYYQTHGGEFRHPNQVHARQIVTDSKEKGEALRKMILDGTPFEEVASKYSLSPDRRQGGDLGWFARGVMPLEFDSVCFFLSPMEMSPLVQSPYGYHLFQVLEKREAGLLGFDEVKESIRKKLMETLGQEAFTKWYETLKTSAKIEVHAELLEENK